MFFLRRGGASIAKSDAKSRLREVLAALL